jgi:hypothetical protein
MHCSQCLTFVFGIGHHIRPQKKKRGKKLQPITNRYVQRAMMYRYKSAGRTTHSCNHMGQPRMSTTARFI